MVSMETSWFHARLWGAMPLKMAVSCKQVVNCTQEFQQVFSVEITFKESWLSNVRETRKTVKHSSCKRCELLQTSFTKVNDETE